MLSEWRGKNQPTKQSAGELVDQRKEGLNGQIRQLQRGSPQVSLSPRNVSHMRSMQRVCVKGYQGGNRYIRQEQVLDGLWNLGGTTEE